MHIKQIIISGFKSFRSQSEFEPFSPKHNVIVGRNGSGKSNFFDAIQFVLLGPKFSNLRQEERQHLLHEGAGTSVMAAYVEIVFDNSDGRLSVESDEVVLRRTVGHKKDEFFLNRKRILKSEVSSLLESAGFSKSNPYYIVQQGKVANLCVMKDQDRLNLLKEVAGTTVYEERRSESLKIMQESNNKQERITEVLTFIDERLNELEREKQELTEYEHLDKQRRACEYTLYDNELSKVNDQLVSMESTREEERERQQELHGKLREIQDELSLHEDSVSTVRSALDRILSRKSNIVAELTTSTSRRSAVEVEIQECELSSKSFLSDKTKFQEQLEEVEGLIEECEFNISQVEPKYEEANNNLSQVQEEIFQIKQRIESLYGKQGRGRQFSSKKERDSFLQTQVDIIVDQVKNKQDLLTKLKTEVEKESLRLNKEKEQFSKIDSENKSRHTRYEELSKEIKERTLYRNDLQEKRKSSWRDLESFQEQIQECKQELDRGKQQLNAALPRNITQGLATVDRIAAEKNLTGYYGPLIDNFSLKNDALRTAVEVAAGNALFHVIVDTDETAAYLMKELEKRKAGRLTFLPLNRIRNPDIIYPDSNDVRPLMDVALDYDADFEEAIKQVFGKKLLARDLETAAIFSKECQLDAITTEGDQVNRRGGFEGGYHDERTSKIGAIMKIRESTKKIKELQENEEALKLTSDETDSLVNNVMRELQKLETERDHLRSNSDQLTKELSSRSKQLDSALEGIKTRRDGLLVLEKEIVTSQNSIDQYESEKKSPLVDKLSEIERNELKNLSEKEKVSQSSIEAIETELNKISIERARLKADLKNNLTKRKEELIIKLSAGSGSGESPDFASELADLEVEKSHIMSIIASTEKEVNEIDEIIDNKRKELSNLEKEMEVKKVEEIEYGEEIAETTKMQDKILNKRTMLIETVQQKQTMIRELGTLPRKELEEFQGLSEKQLLKKLKEVNDHLKKYSSVNRKALDQYVSFNEQRETLISRKSELATDSESIQQLVDSLDAQREEAILRTFRGVSHHFSEVFAELVPGGHGQLIMRTSADEAMGTDGGEELDLGNGNGNGNGGVAPLISTFQGVQVRVTFSAAGQQFEMQQLSGGQKALVALALIFAIQRCDPAPFYLFDEIDQALDANYRAGVARLIQKQVESVDAPAQFITTTFRPELVSVANKFYGIALSNKVSNIHPLTKAEASNFVTNLMHEEEAVGHVTSVPHYAKQQEQLDQIEEPQEGGEEEVEEEEEIDESGLNDLADVVSENLNIDEEIGEESEESDVASDDERLFDVITKSKKGNGKNKSSKSKKVETIISEKKRKSH